MTVRKGTLPTSFFLAMSVVVLWSATPPLAKIAMVFMTPFEFLAARYTIAALVLLLVVFRRSPDRLRQLPASAWLRLIIMGLLTYPLANGLQFWALSRLSATTGTFTMNFVPIFTIILGFIWLSEHPTWLQWLGVVIALVGAVIFFGLNLKIADALFIAASTFGSLLLAIGTILGRSLACSDVIDNISLAALPLSVGAFSLLLFSPPTRVPPWHVVGIVMFLGIVSGALAYSLWYRAMRQLQAFELTIIGNLMPMGTAILASFILGEKVSLQGWVGLTIVLLGVVIVGLRPGNKRLRI